MLLLPKKYLTYNAAYKHERNHAVPKHICQTCQKAFHYKSTLEEHVKLHTGEGLIPCTGCKRKLNTKLAMNAHAINHQNRSFDCKLCSKSFTSLTYLKQHVKGKHEGGFVTLCGTVYPWPKPKFKHEDSCLNCRDIYRKRLDDEKKIQAHIKKKKNMGNSPK